MNETVALRPGPQKKLLRWLILFVIAINLAIIVKVLLPSPPKHNGKTIEQWAFDLNGADQKTREQAVQTFKELGARAVPELIRLLRGKDSWLREKLFAITPKLPSPAQKVVGRFVKPIYWPDVHIVAARALGIIGPDAKEAAPILNEKFRNSLFPVSTEASQALGKIGKDSVPFLIRALEDESGDIRRNAAYALAVIGTNSSPALPSLLALLNDRQEPVRRASAFALTQLGDEGRQALVNVIKDGHGLARRSAISVAHVLQAPDKTIPALLTAGHDADATNRLATINAFVSIGVWKKEVISATAQLLNDPAPEVRLAAIRTLGHAPWKAQDAVPTLTELLDDPNESIRAAAAETLKKIQESPVRTNPLASP